MVVLALHQVLTKDLGKEQDQQNLCLNEEQLLVIIGV